MVVNKIRFVRSPQWRALARPVAPTPFIDVPNLVKLVNRSFGQGREFVPGTKF
jgi:hypothetical protein